MQTATASFLMIACQGVFLLMSARHPGSMRLVASATTNMVLLVLLGPLLVETAGGLISLSIFHIAGITAAQTVLIIRFNPCYARTTIRRVNYVMLLILLTLISYRMFPQDTDDRWRLVAPLLDHSIMTIVGAFSSFLLAQETLIRTWKWLGRADIALGVRLLLSAWLSFAVHLPTFLIITYYERMTLEALSHLIAFNWIVLCSLFVLLVPFIAVSLKMLAFRDVRRPKPVKSSTHRRRMMSQA